MGSSEVTGVSYSSAHLSEGVDLVCQIIDGGISSSSLDAMFDQASNDDLTYLMAKESVDDSQIAHLLESVRSLLGGDGESLSLADRVHRARSYLNQIPDCAEKYYLTAVASLIIVQSGGEKPSAESLKVAVRAYQLDQTNPIYAEMLQALEPYVSSADDKLKELRSQFAAELETVKSLQSRLGAYRV